MKRDTKQLYETIMYNVSKEIKRALNGLSENIRYDAFENIKEGDYYVPEDKDTLIEIINYLLSNDITNLNCIDVSNITDFSYIFNENIYLTSDNGEFEPGKTIWLDMNKWDVSNATTFEGMFGGCTYFDADLSDWDVSNCEIFSGMFYNCESFTCDLSDWDVRNGEKFKAMFFNCHNNETDLSSWSISYDANVVGMIASSTLSCENLGAEAIMF